MDDALPRELVTARNVLLSTFRRDGTTVGTPVWFAPVDGGLAVVTAADSGKVRRLRRDARVTVAACTRVRGRVVGPTHAGSATVHDLGDRPSAHRRVTERYGWQSRFFQWRNRRRGVRMVLVDVRLDGTSAAQNSSSKETSPSTATW